MFKEEMEDNKEEGKFTIVVEIATAKHFPVVLTVDGYSKWLLCLNFEAIFLWNAFNCNHIWYLWFKNQ